MAAPRDRKQPPLWLCLYFHGLPLDQLRLGEALAAVAEKQRIAFVSPSARQAGIKPSMRVATAYALQPEIKIVERRTDREADTLEHLSQWCYQFTPTVQSYKDFSVLLEVGGSLTLFKGLSRLLQQIERGLSQKGYGFTKGLAHTREAAWMLSHFYTDTGTPPPLGDLNEFAPAEADFWLPRLEPLPLTYLDLPLKKRQQLLNMGLNTLGDLLALPRAELGKRFGRDLLKLLADVTGEEATVSSDLKPAHIFAEQLDFANGLTRIDEVHQPLEELLSRLLRFMHQHQLYTQELEWGFYYFKQGDFKQGADKLLIHTSPANNNLQSLLSLSRLKLEQYQLKAPLELLTLTSQCFKPANASSGDLFPELSNPSNQLKDYQQLLDKLLTRLGSEGLKTISMGNEHLPDFQQVVSDLNHQAIEDLRLREPPRNSDSQTQLPLWLNQTPIPIGAPNQSTGPLRLVYGPQRIDSHWWQQRSQRDYFIARHKNGCYCWVFRDLKNRRWFLQGFYG
ncbi:Y-family DNA polymerase [Gilvimarinus sp. F26214L]|uniref:Y-family DNA polymerase n=1 Tax=Gilvimarinus sp. DZF01 TaxID=3461371 RepID=UPI004045E432